MLTNDIRKFALKTSFIFFISSRRNTVGPLFGNKEEERQNDEGRFPATNICTTALVSTVEVHDLCVFGEKSKN